MSLWSGRRAHRSGSLARGAFSGVRFTWLNVAVMPAPSAARALRLTSAESASSEQHASGCSEVEGAPIDSEEDASLPLAWDWQQSPSAFIEQWLSAVTLEGAVKQPVRQFKPPHHNMTARAARRLIHSLVGGDSISIKTILLTRPALSPAARSLSQAFSRNPTHPASTAQKADGALEQ